MERRAFMAEKFGKDVRCQMFELDEGSCDYEIPMNGGKR